MTQSCQLNQSLGSLFCTLRRARFCTLRHQTRTGSSLATVASGRRSNEVMFTVLLRVASKGAHANAGLFRMLQFFHLLAKARPPGLRQHIARRRLAAAALATRRTPICAARPTPTPGLHSADTKPRPAARVLQLSHHISRCQGPATHARASGPADMASVDMEVERQASTKSQMLGGADAGTVGVATCNVGVGSLVAPLRTFRRYQVTRA